MPAKTSQDSAWYTGTARRVLAAALLENETRIGQRQKQGAHLETGLVPSSDSAIAVHCRASRGARGRGPQGGAGAGASPSLGRRVSHDFVKGSPAPLPREQTTCPCYRPAGDRGNPSGLQSNFEIISSCRHQDSCCPVFIYENAQ